MMRHKWLNANYIANCFNTESASRKCLSNGSWEMNVSDGRDEGNYSECNFNVLIQVSVHNK